MIKFVPYLIGVDGQKIEADFEVKQIGDNVDIALATRQDCRGGEVVLLEGRHNMPPKTRFYADGYTKLSQYAGTLATPAATTYFTDKDHYKMPQTKGYFTVYNYIYFYSDATNIRLIGAVTGRRFRLEIRFNDVKWQVVQVLEGIKISAGQRVELEVMTELVGEKQSVLAAFGDKIAALTPIKQVKEYPAGWCSWYCVGPNIAEKDIFDNLKEIRKKVPQLKYLQIDDGFQPHMGDWLQVGDKFSRPMKDICLDIKRQGCEPAIWLAPFIASAKSELLAKHPEYFVKGDDGKPMCTTGVTFQGWRDAPWYCLDGTHPGARKYIYDTVRTIYKDWGVKYYKLDANVWGALPFGNRHDPSKTCIEAYHMGMQALWEAVEDDAFVLGCNAPMWASIGEVSGMRITGDLVRNIRTIYSLTDECFSRNWMNNKLWVNDPDCVILSGGLTKLVGPGGKFAKLKISRRMYKLNNIYARASGGIILSGDYINKYGSDQIGVIDRLVKASHRAAVFDQHNEVGVIENERDTEYVLFGRGARKHIAINVPKGCVALDMYAGLPLKVKDDKVIFNLKKHDAEWIKIEKV